MTKLYSRYAKWVQHLKISVTHNMNEQKKKIHKIISTDAEKAFDNI